MGTREAVSGAGALELLKAGRARARQLGSVLLLAAAPAVAAGPPLLEPAAPATLRADAFPRQVLRRRLVHPLQMPAFIPTVRAYGGGGYGELQRTTMRDLGLDYGQGLVDLSWENLEPRQGEWKWGSTDAQMDALAAADLKLIPFVICPKLGALHWDPTVPRSDPRYVAEYEELAYQIAHRYHAHPAWSGLVAVWGGSADVWDREYPLTDPEVVVPLLNAAYAGIKRAAPTTIVIGFNFATTAGPKADWEEYHERAFALAPRFDWYGVQSHTYPATYLDEPGSYRGVQGLANVRAFLDAHGYAAKPLWLNEGGIAYGEADGGLAEPAHAEQVVQLFIVSRTMPVDLRGWVYFEYFAKTGPPGPEDDPSYGLMTDLDEHDPPLPRQAWTAYRTLLRQVHFADYDFDARSPDMGRGRGLIGAG